MCGRFNVVSDPLNRFIVEITGRGFDIEDQYNIAPTEQVPVLLKSQEGQWELERMRWWLVPSWVDEPGQKYAMYNAKSETLARSRAFREPFRRRRCIVPASGYYEWKKEGRMRLPFYITPAETDGFAFAALWDRWQKDERVILSCTIVTTAAPKALLDVHDRIPVHMTDDQIKVWMNREAGQEELSKLLSPGMRMPLAVTPVSTVVNNARNKDERCVEPVGDTRVLSC